MDIKSRRDMMQLHLTMRPQQGLRLYLHRHSVMDGIALLLSDYNNKFLMSDATHRRLSVLDQHKVWTGAGTLDVDIWPIGQNGFDLDWLLERLGVHLSSADILER